MPIPTPQTEEDIIQAIRLFRSDGVGPVAFHSLTEDCDSFEAAFARVSAKLSGGQYEGAQICSRTKAEEEFLQGQKLGAQFLHCQSENYPKLLDGLPDRPPFLWALGDLSLLERTTLAIIGSRNPSIEGVRMSMMIAKVCNYENVAVVSGLARGIDASAHEAAFTGGTVGVVAGGLDVLYPKSNAQLQELMCKDGLVLSEMPFGHQPRSRDFPKRNRIIAGISRAVLVIEANLRSGTRLTVNDAARYGREIMAVPGHPFSGLAALPNQLIAEGAHLVRDFEDIADVFGLSLINQADSKEEIATAQIDVQNLQRKDDAAALGRAIIEGRAVAQGDGKVSVVNRLDSTD